MPVPDMLVKNRDLCDSAVSTRTIENDAVTTVKITNLAVTDAKIDTLTFGKITGGTVTAETLILQGSSGILKSDNYSAGSAGWQIDGAGNAEFNDVTVRGVLAASTIEGLITLTGAGDLKSTTWDGASPANLATVDATATAGFYIDGSAGAAQFMTIYAEGGSIENLTITGTLTLGTSGLIRTASSGERIEITESTNDAIEFYDASSAVPGKIEVLTGTDSTLKITAPSSNDMRAQIKLDGRSTFESADFILAGSTRMDVRDTGMRWYVSGSESAPTIHWSGSTGTGIFLQTTNVLSIAAGGKERARFGVTDINFYDDANQVVLQYDDSENAGQWEFLTSGGARTWTLFKTGNEHRLTPGADTATDYLEFNDSSNQWDLYIGGVNELKLGSTGFDVPNVYNETDAGAANVVVLSDGSLKRSTSALRYKPGWTDVSLEGIIEKLKPITWQVEDRTYFGLGAEHVAEVWPEAVVVGPLTAVGDGRPDPEIGIIDYDTRAILAALVAEVQQVTARLAVVEGRS